jgi:hypothetical protein
LIIQKEEERHGEYWENLFRCDCEEGEREGKGGVCKRSFRLTSFGREEKADKHCKGGEVGVCGEGDRAGCSGRAMACSRPSVKRVLGERSCDRRSFSIQILDITVVMGII